MEINLMTWNTELYVYENFESYKEKDAPVEEITKVIQDFMTLNENPIVVLQEIPFKKWKEYTPNFKKMKEFFEKNNFDMFLWENDEQKLKWVTGIKLVTAIIAKNGLLSEPSDIKIDNEKDDYYNRFVPVIIRDKDIHILGVHAPNAFELNKLIKGKKGYAPNIIIGDFNSGNYVKEQNDAKIMVNRANFQLLSTGYIDACQGKYTTCYPEPTQIDHILIENSFQFNKRYKLIDVNVYNNITHSDHYPIHCKMTID